MIRSGSAPLARGILLLLILALNFCAVPLTASAADTPWSAAEAPPEESRAGSVYLCNVDTNIVLYQKNADVRIYPTSSVKIMTGLLACRALCDRTDETVQITAPMLAGSTGRNLGLVTGEEIKIFDLLMAAVCGSYNDAACVVAYLSAGSVDAFVTRMNQEAQRLGATQTVYTNPTGIHDPAMVTTAAETAAVAREALKDRLFMELVSAHVHTIPANNAADERTITNRNALVSDTGGQYYNGWCRGMNAGMTDEGGWCVITLWEKNGASHLSVVMNAADVAVGAAIPAYTYTNRLLSWAGRNFAYRTVLFASDALDTLPVAMTGTSKSETDVFIPEDLKVFLPSHVDIASQVDVSVHITDGRLKAPLAEGQAVGSVTVSYGGETVGSTVLVVKESFERNGFLNFLTAFRSYMTSRPFLITLVIFAILLALYLRSVIGPGRRYTSKQTYRPERRRKRRYRSLKKARWHR